MAFRTTAASLAAAAGGGPCDVAVQLEAGEWRGAVEPLVVLRGACATEPGHLELVGEEPFWTGLGRALEPGAPVPLTSASRAGEGRRVLDRRGEGLAGVAADLVSSGGRVLIACADVSRRREGLESLLGGLARRSAPRAPALLSWASLAREPGLAADFEHLLAVDPPDRDALERLLADAPGPAVGAWSHRAWGEAERAFALMVATAEWDAAAALRRLYRALAGRPGRRAGGEELRRLLEGPGAHPRTPERCGRLVRMLVEIGLASYDPHAPAGPTLRVVSDARTSLERSATHRRALERLAEARRYLAPGASRRHEPAAA
jgi:hypothetical protein